MDIGARIKSIRQQQNRTQEEIARQCGFTKSLLSKIENGKTMPPVATLMKIAEAFGVDIGDLLSARQEVSTLFTSGETASDPAKGILTDKGYSFFAFAAGRSDKKIQPYLFTARKGDVNAGRFSHRGEEFIYVLEGEMRYRVGPVEYTMRAGDSLYFNALEEHSLSPVTDEVKFLAVFTTEQDAERT